jgi:TonB family protein
VTTELSNFLAWYLQIAVAVIAGALLPFAFRLSAPKPRLAFWYALLAACVILPAIQPWHPGQVLVRSDVSASSGPLRILEDGQSDASKPWTANQVALVIIAGGGLLRLMWLCGGMLRLRRYRRAAELVLPLPDEARSLMQRLGVHASLYLSEDVSSPVTFGVRDPVILLPAGFFDMPVEKREPVICHELLHVQRSDWLYAIGEELVRCALWFHPAVWWLLGRIQLTREQLVDSAVIEYTNAAEHYVDALIAIASTRLEADLAPAPLFLKKRHLRQRVASIVKGVSMSHRSLLLSSIAAFSALPLVLGIAAWQFPLNAAPQEVQDAPGVEVVGGYPKVLHRAPLAYPADARQKGISGGVVVSVTVDSHGEVTDARVVSGTPELRKAALESVLTWHFAMDPWEIAPGDTRPVPPSFEVAIKYTAGPASQPAAKLSSLPPTAKFFPMDRLDTSALPSALRERVAAAVSGVIREGDIVTLERFNELTQAVKGVDSHLTLRGSIRNDKMTLVPALDSGSNVFKGNPYAFTGPPAAASADPSAPQRIRVGGNVQAENIVTKVTPLYPPEAKQARVQGTVRFNATIDKEGHVANLELISGHPLLVPSAVDAVKQWIYRPTLLNGNPVEVMTQIDINYTLTQ